MPATAPDKLPENRCQLLPPTGLSTLGFDPACFQTEPPACYRASWQLPGPDFHRQATTSLRTARSAATSQRHLPLCWAHERPRLVRKSAGAVDRFEGLAEVVGEGVGGGGGMRAGLGLGRPV